MWSCFCRSTGSSVEQIQTARVHARWIPGRKCTRAFSQFGTFSGLAQGSNRTFGHVWIACCVGLYRVHASTVCVFERELALHWYLRWGSCCHSLPRGKCARLYIECSSCGITAYRRPRDSRFYRLRSLGQHPGLSYKRIPMQIRRPCTD